MQGYRWDFPFLGTWGRGEALHKDTGGKERGGKGREKERYIEYKPCTLCYGIK